MSYRKVEIVDEPPRPETPAPGARAQPSTSSAPSPPRPQHWPVQHVAPFWPTPNATASTSAQAAPRQAPASPAEATGRSPWPASAYPAAARSPWPAPAYPAEARSPWPAPAYPTPLWSPPAAPAPEAPRPFYPDSASLVLQAYHALLTVAAAAAPTPVHSPAQSPAHQVEFESRPPWVSPAPAEAESRPPPAPAAAFWGPEPARGQQLFYAQENVLEEPEMEEVQPLPDQPEPEYAHANAVIHVESEEEEERPVLVPPPALLSPRRVSLTHRHVYMKRKVGPSGSGNSPLNVKTTICFYEETEQHEPNCPRVRELFRRQRNNRERYDREHHQVVVDLTSDDEDEAGRNKDKGDGPQDKRRKTE